MFRYNSHPFAWLFTATSTEVYSRSGRNASGALDGRGLVAVIKRQVPLAGQLDHELAWGQGWGWVTMPNGAWSGRKNQISLVEDLLAVL